MRDRGHDRQEGSRARQGSCGESELSNGDSGNNFGATDGARIRGRDAARIHALVAGNRALLPPAHARGRRAGLAAGVLAGHRLGIWQLRFAPAADRASSTISIIFIPAR